MMSLILTYYTIFRAVGHSRRCVLLTLIVNSVTGGLAERTMVANAETIRVELRDTDMEVEQKLC